MTPVQRWAFAAAASSPFTAVFAIVRRSAALISARRCKFSRTSRETPLSTLLEPRRPASMLNAIIIDATPTSA